MITSVTAAASTPISASPSAAVRSRRRRRRVASGASNPVSTTHVPSAPTTAHTK